MTIYFNGSFMPLEQAKVPVLDRGFIFGDGVYEVIPVYSRRAFRLREHLARLQHSLDGIQLPNPHTADEWVAILTGLIARNAPQDQYLYLHITRGVAPRDHAFPNPPVTPTVFAMSNPLVHPPAALLQSGVACITAQDNRWLRCDIKAIALLPNVLLRQSAVAAGCAEAILIRDDSFLTEGAAS
ncbi:MAG: D-amino acid aminotransferase, partial [Gallionellaceae bacterium CG02_land_8_20_14_3_00_60_115]